MLTTGIFNIALWLALTGLFIFIISYIFYKVTKIDFLVNIIMLGIGMFMVFILMWGVFVTGYLYSGG
jgi:hypothetical protein